MNEPTIYVMENKKPSSIPRGVYQTFLDLEQELIKIEHRRMLYYAEKKKANRILKMPKEKKEK